MKVRKNTIMTALTVLCLTMVLFSVIPTRSTVGITRSTSGSYDAWLDTNDDGLIDMEDVGAVASAYLATGDPTKNVNVTNWPDILNMTVINSYNCPLTARKALNQSLGSGAVNQSSYWFSSSAVVDCYTQYYLYVTYSGPVTLNVEVLFTTGGIEYKADGFQVTAPYYSTLAGPYAIKGAQMRIRCSQAISSIVPDYVNSVALYAFNP